MCILHGIDSFRQMLRGVATASTIGEPDGGSIQFSGRLYQFGHAFLFGLDTTVDKLLSDMGGMLGSQHRPMSHTTGETHGLQQPSVNHINIKHRIRLPWR